MIKQLLSLILIFIITTQTSAQKNAVPTEKDKFSAKSIKEDYPDENIAIIKGNQYITFGFDRKSNKVTVIKKTNESLINLDSRSDIQKYCFYDGESEIRSFVIKYKNNRKAEFPVEDDAYTNDNLFHNDVRVKYVNLDFPLKGSRYNTEIIKYYKDVKYFTSLYFNDDYPTLKKTIKIEIPNWLNLELKEMNFEDYSIKKTTSLNSKNKSKIYTFTLDNVQAMHKDENAPGPSYIYPHILILAKSYDYNGKKGKIFDSTQDLYNWYKSLVNSLENDNTLLKEKVKELTKNLNTDEEKIKAIYYWVQDNIRYIAFEDGIAGFKPDEASNVFSKKYGDCKGMANLTKQMLIEAGYDARLTWIGTKRIAYDYSTPNLSVDNHMICSLFINDEIIFLDGTEKFNSYKEYAERIQGKQVLIENKDEFILAKVPITEAESNIEKINYELTLEDNLIVGSVTKTFNGESRSSLLHYFNQLKNDKKDTFLKWYLNKGNSNIKVSDIVISDILNRDIELDISYQIEIENVISKFDNTIYIDLDLNKEFSNYNFEERKTDYLFSFKKDFESTIRLTIPSGYIISELPEDISVSSNNYDMKITFVKKGNVIIYMKKFVIKNALIETSDFEEWNQFIKNLNNLYNEQITLIKE